MQKFTACNEKGLPIGESHHRAKVADRDVDLIRELREEHGATYSQIRDWWNVSKAWLTQVCNYRIRAQSVAGHRRGTDTPKRKG